MATQKKHFINREISWLDFNHRVLQEAANPDVPLLERLRFLGIYSNNLDEFFRVRVANLQRIKNLKADIRLIYPDNPQEVLNKIVKIVKKQRRQFNQLYKVIMQELREHNIEIINEAQLSNEQSAFIMDLYDNQLVNSLSPIFVSQIKGFPEFKDSNPYLIVRLSKEKAKEYALIELPIDEYPRYIQLPSNSDTQYIIMLDDVVRLCLPSLFKNLDFKKYEAYSIKITRDAEMDFNQDIRSNMLERISEGLKERYKGVPVRLTYDKTMPAGMLNFIILRLGINNNTSLFAGGRYHNFRDLINFPEVGESDWRYEEWTPAPTPAFENSNNLAQLIYKKDVYLHCPYHNFSHYIRFLREASIDPDVKSIKTTVYRLANDSRIVKALINAANNGKKVTVVVELLARFDESANISWAQRMQDAGIKVLFGVEGLKIHSKLTYIHRKNGDMVCVGTGNFHEKNASRYTDIFLFTAHKGIVNDVCRVFDLIDQPYSPHLFKHLLVSPHQMRKKLYSLIRREVSNAKQGKTAYILCKINHITDRGIINRLYNAAGDGVKIDLIVRGSCSMVSGKNIKIISIVDKYLEHSRIFIFANSGSELYYISSADWMTRNLDHRVEVAVPVLDSAIQLDLKNIVANGLRDDIKARIIDGSGKNKLVEGKGLFRSQWELYKYHAHPQENYQVYEEQQ